MALFKGKAKEEKKADKKASKKPIYKKVWFWIIVVLVVFAALGSSGDKNDEQPDASDKASTSETVSSTEAPDDTDDAPAASSLDVDVTFYDTFKNDTTGKWKKALVSTSEDIQEYALDYYQEYFKSDDEVHVIYNFSLNTVNCLTVNGDTLFISITDYVDGEEHDAKAACGGTHLGDLQISIESGEVTYNSFDE